MIITTIVRKWARTTYMYLCYITRPRKEKTVFFASFRGQYSDNPRAISECLHRMTPDVKIVWLIKPQYKQYVPDYVTVVPLTPRLSLKAQAQANVWVLNYIYRKQLGVYKGKDNYYIQTWHGDRGLKTIGYLTDYSKGRDYNGYDMSDCDLFVAASDYGIRKARQGFLYDGEIIVEGMPRNDKLVNIDKFSDEVVEVRRRLGISNDVKVMLYAPTFRDDGDTDCLNIDFDNLREKLAGMRQHIWGVSTEGHSGERMEHVDFTVHYGDDEQFIHTRLEREKRCGTVERIDGNTSRFSADVYDCGELVPWIRTFICRIEEIHFSDKELGDQFKKDIEEMYLLYNI